MIETPCSTGAALTVWGENKNTVGLENNTSFLKAVRGGRLRYTAKPRPRASFSMTHPPCARDRYFYAARN